VEPFAYCYGILNVDKKVFFKKIIVNTKGGNENHPGHYSINFLNVLISGIDRKDLKCRLFFDVPFYSSLKLIFARTRILA
jgi:hypothetical protein